MKEDALGFPKRQGRGAGDAREDARGRAEARESPGGIPDQYRMV